MLEDNPHSGRHVSIHNDENVKCIDELLDTKRRILNHYIAETHAVNRETVQLIIVEDLRMRKLSSCIVPKSLTAEQKQCQLDVVTDWFEQCAADSNFYTLLFHSLFKVEFDINHFVLGEH